MTDRQIFEQNIFDQIRGMLGVLPRGAPYHSRISPSQTRWDTCPFPWPNQHIDNPDRESQLVRRLRNPSRTKPTSIKPSEDITLGTFNKIWSLYLRICKFGSCNISHSPAMHSCPMCECHKDYMFLVQPTQTRPKDKGSIAVRHVRCRACPW